ncbi:3-hydroxyacyl-CoA dehydrogenase, NAD binding domain [Geosmithia morbida]|uniref:3-hydroxyacyl-CoA dehydrogenase, NAD binding domain n=1 Tax=Geosmithia morbida TaxID=1094350 RepID=A0A9P5D0W3_9HYPO|nr:3-hydroxyacyl-CoA dehydrogenase, NAD binding domain [Geosmithia morbida]KAF4122072.1 3-hydroxyacyl-CoA dehydrogenase, NAD binding domain [Geosmithia morbida]
MYFQGESLQFDAWVKENKTAAALRKTRRGHRRQSSAVTSSDTTVSQTCRSPGSPDWPSPAGRDHAQAASYPSCYVDNGASSSMLAPSPPAPWRDILSPLETRWLFSIYHMGFDTVFGSWMGRFCCPFVYEYAHHFPQRQRVRHVVLKSRRKHRAGKNSRADKCVRISDLCRKLDMCMEYGTLDGPRADGDDHVMGERYRKMDESLDGAILSFSARWLPLVVEGMDSLGGESNVIQVLWRQARRDMLRVINRPSYRSMLSLFLFASTPIPAGISEEEEADGISGQACVHAALQHIQILRARQRNLQFNGSKVSPCQQGRAAVMVPAARPDPADAVDFIDAESTTYWAALTFDTSASLTLNCRSLLSSGLFGFDEELPWRLVRTCAQMFNETSQEWQSSSLSGRTGSSSSTVELTDERANQIIGAASAWKLLSWKLIAIFKEALRDGHEETRVRKAYSDVVDSINYFNTTFRPHLDACQRRMQFLDQKTKLRWYALMLHYHLSILMLVDILEATERYDLLSGLEEVSLEAENAVMNTLVFGLHNVYTMSVGTQDDDLQAGVRDGGDDVNRCSVKLKVTAVPLTSIDPYPHHILAGVQLLRRAIERDFEMGKITDESYAHLQSTLGKTLSLLPQSSKSVRAARSGDEGRRQHQDPYRVLHSNIADSY